MAARRSDGKGGAAGPCDAPSAACGGEGHMGKAVAVKPGGQRIPVPMYRVMLGQSPRSLELRLLYLLIGGSSASWGKCKSFAL